jgi:hypothetical protein
VKTESVFGTCLQDYETRLHNNGDRVTDFFCYIVIKLELMLLLLPDIVLSAELLDVTVCTH